MTVFGTVLKKLKAEMNNQNKELDNSFRRRLIIINNVCVNIDKSTLYAINRNIANILEDSLVSNLDDSIISIIRKHAYKF